MKVFMTREEHEEMAKPKVYAGRTGAGGASLFTVALGVVAGATALFFFDPKLGRRRRATLADRVNGMTRDGTRRWGRVTRRTASRLSGMRARIAGIAGDDEPVDDITLTDRVESQVFREQDLPKGDLNIDTVGGVVMIRGQVERPDIMSEIVARTWRVEGVKDVRNLMHLPGTPAPHID